LQNEERSERLEINEEEGKRTQNQAREPGEQKIYIDFYCRDIIQSWVYLSSFQAECLYIFPMRRHH
jgi:hypothetical protein